MTSKILLQLANMFVRGHVEADNKHFLSRGVDSPKILVILKNGELYNYNICSNCHVKPLSEHMVNHVHILVTQHYM